MRFVVIFILFFASNTFVYSQVDSLLILYNNTEIKDEKLEYLSLITDEFRGETKFNRDSLAKYSDLMLSHLDKNESSKHSLKANTLQLIVNYHGPFDQYEKLANRVIEDCKRLKYYDQLVSEYYYLGVKSINAGIDISDSLQDIGLKYIEEYKDSLGSAYSTMKVAMLTQRASSCEKEGAYSKALEQVLEAEKIAEEYKDSSALLKVYRTASGILGDMRLNMHYEFENWNDKDGKWRNYLFESYNLSKKLNKTLEFMVSCINLGKYYISQDSLLSAKAFLEEGLNHNKAKFTPLHRFNLYKNIIKVELALGNKKSVLEALSQLESAASELKLNRYQYDSNLIKADVYLYISKYRDAKSILKLNDNIEHNNIELKKDFFEKKYIVHKELSEYKQALENYEKHISIKDSLANLSSKESITNLLAKYDKAESERKIAILKADNLKQKIKLQRQVAGALFLTLLCICTFLLYWIKSKQNHVELEKKNLEIEQKLFRSMMNPHFIFNTLGSIQSFLLNKNKSQDAAYYLTKFAKLMRQILTQSNSSFISLKEEVGTLQNYLMLQKMRFENKFDFKIHVDSEIDTEEIHIPPMLLQPIIENSIEHGKVYKVNGGKIDILFTLEKDMLKAEIMDNGIGLYAKELNVGLHKKESVAIGVIKKRLDYLKDKFGGQIGFDLQPGQQSGTIASFILPKL